MQIYVKQTSNYPAGMPLIDVTVLSEIWVGESLMLAMGKNGEHTRKVVGWTDLCSGRQCPVSVARFQWEGKEGYLIWGGNSGLRVLDEEHEPEEWEAHLPRGYGRPIFWVALGDERDLPSEVMEVIRDGSA